MENFPKNLRLLRILSAESTFGAKEWIVFVYFKVEILGKGLTFFFSRSDCLFLRIGGISCLEIFFQGFFPVELRNLILDNSR